MSECERTILAIDLATVQTGWFTGPLGGSAAMYGMLTVPKMHHDNRAARLYLMRGMLADTVSRVHPDIVAIYAPFCRGADATRCAWGIAGILEVLCYGNQVDLKIEYEGSVRAWAEIKSGAEKGGRRDELKQKCLDWCAEKGYTFTPQQQDIADACLLWHYMGDRINPKESESDEGREPEPAQATRKPSKSAAVAVPAPVGKLRGGKTGSRGAVVGVQAPKDDGTPRRVGRKRSAKLSGSDGSRAR